VLAVFAVAVAWWSSGVLPWLVLAYLFFSVLYSRHLKGTVLLGNVTVAALVGSLPLYGGVAAGHVDAKLIAASTMVFCFCLGQEILFTLEDVKGDSAAGLRTTATQFGAAGSLRLFQTVMLVASAVCLLPWYLGIAGTAYAIAALVCTVIPTLIAAFSPRPNGDPRKLALAADSMGVIWWTSIVPLLLLR
jgi:4-hydroxybenzoate polyprenyltransferase